MTEKAPQYDKIGSSYEEYARSSTLKRAERYTLLGLAGSMNGKTMLDLACGAGYFTRLLRLGGAAYVIGVDISPEMVRLAKIQEEDAPLGIEYRVHDAISLPQLGKFDLVTAAYLLNYAATRGELLAMCRGAYNNLANGGRFLAFTANPDFDVTVSDFSRYGVRALRGRPDGDRYICRLEFLTDPPRPFQYYQWSRAAYEWALHTAGFSTVRWQAIEVSPEDVAAYGEEYWRELRDNCLCIGLDCTK